jgi:hypothetical protein
MKRAISIIHCPASDIKAQAGNRDEYPPRRENLVTPVNISDKNIGSTKPIGAAPCPMATITRKLQISVINISLLTVAIL